MDTRLHNCLRSNKRIVQFDSLAITVFVVKDTLTKKDNIVTLQIFCRII
jgi:hypothetical protein